MNIYWNEKANQKIKEAKKKKKPANIPTSRQKIC